YQPSFLKLYWEEFGESSDGLLLAFGEDDAGEQVAAVGFERSGDKLRFLGGVEITDYLGPVARAGVEDAFAGALWGARRAREGVATAGLWGIAEDSGWYALLGDAAASRGMSVEEALDHDGVAPYLELPPTWDGYLDGLPAKLRHEIRRK